VNVTCLENSTIPFNIANISWFDCPDEHGNQLYNLTCSGNETYFDDLTCNSVQIIVASCAFWDHSIDDWSNEGCELMDQVNGSLNCKCNHLTDYAAQFATIGANFLSTISFLSEISLADLLAALPALIFFGTICGTFTYAMIRSYKTYKQVEKEKILEELKDPATAVLFQLALQEENVARFLVGKATNSRKKNKHGKVALVTYEEMFMAFCLSDGTRSETKAEKIRILFNAIDIDGDRELSTTELFKFFRFANPGLTKEDVTNMTGLVKFTKNAAGVGVISCDEFIRFFSVITSNLDDERFEANLQFWLEVKETEKQIKKSVGLSEHAPDVLGKEAVGWAQAQNYALRDNTSRLPPPMFEPWREKDTEVDTKELDDMLVAKALVEHNTQQLKGFKDVRGNFWKEMCINHPIVNLFSDFTELHRHQQIMVLFLDVMAALFVEAVLFDSVPPETEEDFEESAEASKPGAPAGGGRKKKLNAAAIFADLESTIVFGIIGGVASSFFSIVAVSLFMNAMNKETQMQTFDEQAKRVITRLEDLSVATSVPKLRHESCIAKARVRVATRDYIVYEEQEREQNREPLPKSLLLGMLHVTLKEVDTLLKGAQKREAQEDKVELRNRFLEEVCQPGVKALVKKRFLAHFVKKRIKKDIASEREEEAFQFHLTQIDAMDRELHLQNMNKYKNMGRIKGYVFWKYIMNHDEQIEIVSDAVAGRTKYLVMAWSLSIIWTMWCLLYVLTWLMKLNSPGMDEEGNPLPATIDPLDWVKAFFISSVFDFILLTPISIMVTVVLFPMWIVWATKSQVSASYGGDLKDLDVQVITRVDGILREKSHKRGAAKVTKVGDLSPEPGDSANSDCDYSDDDDSSISENSSSSKKSSSSCSNDLVFEDADVCFAAMRSMERGDLQDDMQLDDDGSSIGSISSMNSGPDNNLAHGLEDKLGVSSSLFTNGGLWTDVADCGSVVKNENKAMVEDKTTVENKATMLQMQKRRSLPLDFKRPLLRSATLGGYFNRNKESRSSATGSAGVAKASPAAPTAKPNKLRRATTSLHLGNSRMLRRTADRNLFHDDSRDRFKNVHTSTTLSGDMDYAEGTSVEGVSTWMVSKEIFTQESFDYGSGEDDSDYDSEESDIDAPILFECQFPNSDANPSILLPLSLAQKVPALRDFWAQSNSNPDTNENRIVMDMEEAGITREEIFNAIYIEETNLPPQPPSFLSLLGLPGISEEEGAACVTVHAQPPEGSSSVTDGGALSRAWV
jgi:Ca2+-binding EF-hand superfamily protein